QGYGVPNAHRALREARSELHALPGGHLRPPHVEAGKLVFEYHNDAAANVALAGSFNEWGSRPCFFERVETGLWRAAITLPHGSRHHYKFIVDGSRWVEDPANGLQEPDGYGGLNSVVNLASAWTGPRPGQIERSGG